MPWGPALLKCMGDICGSKTAAARNAPMQGASEAAGISVIKPVVRLDDTQNRVTTPESLMTNLGMLPAPPRMQSPQAVVSTDFQHNSSRLMVLLPSAGAAAGTFQPHLGGCGSPESIVRWADANGFATALFFAEHLQKDPAGVWEGVLKGSPAKFAVIVVGTDMMPALQKALSSMHSLLFSRFRVACVIPNSQLGLTISPSLPQELRKHLEKAVVELPDSVWGSANDGRAAHQQLLEVVISRQDRLESNEMRKYSGFQNLQENDMPGLKRLGVDERVAKLDRDRGNDELARLCKHNCDDDDQEPAVD